MSTKVYTIKYEDAVQNHHDRIGTSLPIPPYSAYVFVADSGAPAIAVLCYGDDLLLPGRRNGERGGRCRKTLLSSGLAGASTMEERAQHYPDLYSHMAGATIFDVIRPSVMRIAFSGRL